MANRWGNSATDFIFLGSKVTVDGDDSHKIKTLAPWKKNYDKPRQYIKMRRYYFANKGAAAAAESLQSCLTLCDPIDGSPPGSAIPGILQARTLEWIAIAFSSARK